MFYHTLGPHCAGEGKREGGVRKLLYLTRWLTVRERGGKKGGGKRETELYELRLTKSYSQSRSDK